MLSSIRLPFSQAKRILLARALEECGAITSDVSQKASLKASHTLGETSKIEIYLSERSESILSSVDQQNDKLLQFSGKSLLSLAFSLCIFSLAFILGIASERLTTPEHLLNLFSLSLFGIIIWNLAAYILIFLIGCGLISYSWLPLRQTLIHISEKLVFGYSKKNSPKARYFALLTKILMPTIVRFCVRNLHIAASFFAIGLIASLFLKGLSTSYWAIWESTWFYDDFEAVKYFLDHTYGLIPAVFGLEVMPSLDAVANMRSDNLIYIKTGASAAPWIIRGSLLLTVFVIIPRWILAAVEHIRMNRFLNTVTLSLADPYYKTVIEEGNISAQTGDLFFITDTTTHKETQAVLKRQVSLWGNLSKEAIFKIDSSADLIGFPSIRNEEDHSHLVLLAFNAISTPEEDLEGRTIDTLKATFERNHNIILGIFLDARTLEKRLVDYPHRINERISLWEDFIKTHNLPLFIEHTDTTATSAMRRYFNEKALLARNIKTETHE